MSQGWPSNCRRGLYIVQWPRGSQLLSPLPPLRDIDLCALSLRICDASAQQNFGDSLCSCRASSDVDEVSLVELEGTPKIYDQLPCNRNRLARWGIPWHNARGNCNGYNCGFFLRYHFDLHDRDSHTGCPSREARGVMVNSVVPPSRE